MSTEDGIVRSISWRDLCPGTILFRLYRISITLQLLLLAFVGAWATTAGWRASRAICLSNDTLQQPAIERFLQRTTTWPDSVYWQPLDQLVIPPPVDTVPKPENSAAAETPANSSLPLPADGASRGHSGSPSAMLLGRIWHGWLGATPMYAIMEPVRRWFDPSISWDQFAFYGLGGLWSLLVWSLIGGAITRTAIVRLGRDERVGLRESLEFSGRKFFSILGAPLLPLAAVFGLGVPLFVLGLLMRTNIGVAIGGMLWLPVGLVGFSMTLFAVGVLFGWPLMWSAICTEGSDAFDAISRSYAYTYQRPLQYFAYAVGALLLGFLGWVLVGLFCQAIIQFALLAVGTGTGDARLEVLQTAMAEGNSSSWLLEFGGTLMAFLNRCFLGLQVAFAYSFMWTAAAAIYLLLRYHADQTEIDDVFLEEDESVRYGLPPLVADEAGVPGVDEVADSAGKAHRPADLATTDGHEVSPTSLSANEYQDESSAEHTEDNDRDKGSASD